MQEAPDVTSTTEQLIAALNEGGFQYALIGGVAVIVNGYDRTTQDVDAVVWELDERLLNLVEILHKHGFSFRVPEGVADARRIRVLRLQSKAEVNVDLSMGFLPFELEIISRANNVELADGVHAKVATVEDLVIMKLVASRPRDLDDITRLLELYPIPDKKRIRRIVSDYADVLDRPEILINMKDRLR